MKKQRLLTCERISTPTWKSSLHLSDFCKHVDFLSSAGGGNHETKDIPGLPIRLQDSAAGEVLSVSANLRLLPLVSVASCRMVSFSYASSGRTLTASSLLRQPQVAADAPFRIGTIQVLGEPGGQRKRPRDCGRGRIHRSFVPGDRLPMKCIPVTVFVFVFVFVLVLVQEESFD